MVLGFFHSFLILEVLIHAPGSWNDTWHLSKATSNPMVNSEHLSPTYSLSKKCFDTLMGMARWTQISGLWNEGKAFQSLRSPTAIPLLLLNSDKSHSWVMLGLTWESSVCSHPVVTEAQLGHVVLGVKLSPSHMTDLWSNSLTFELYFWPPINFPLSPFTIKYFSNFLHTGKFCYSETWVISVKRGG